MKGLKTLLFGMAIMPLLASCDFFSLDGDEREHSAIVVTNCDTEVFANTTKAYVGFAAYGGKWQMSLFSGGEWCEPSRTSGSSNYWYSIPLTLEQNETGKARGVVFKVSDTEGEGYSHFSIRQYATRGDGSMGNSPCVSSIKGDDGSEINIKYDAQRRPTSLTMSKGDALLRNFNIRYNSDTTIVVGNMTASHNIGYMPDTALVSTTDTVDCEVENLYDEYVVTFEERKRTGMEGFAMLLNAKQSFGVDSIRVADSLKYAKIEYGGKKYTVDMKLEYSANDNRRQSVDANQLLLGIDNCNPYALLGLYRHTRLGRIISKASVGGLYGIRVETTHNADGSVATMTVYDERVNALAAVRVYTFEY